VNASIWPPKAPESDEMLDRLLLKTGRSDCYICFYPSLFRLVVHRNGEEERVELGFAGCRLLERLLREPGEVVSREQLIACGWAGRVVGEGSLNQQIYSLRQLFCDERGREIIQTLPRRGYQFNPLFVSGLEPARSAAEPSSDTPPSTVADAPVVVEAEPPRVPHVRRHWLLKRVVVAVVAGLAFVGLATVLTWFGILPPWPGTPAC
jgi:cholera toxin transcriptional activator